MPLISLTIQLCELYASLLLHSHMLIDVRPCRARFFSGAIKVDAFGPNAKTCVCEIWVRDKDLFHSISKASTLHNLNDCRSA